MDVRRRPEVDCRIHSCTYYIYFPAREESHTRKNKKNKKQKNSGKGEEEGREESLKITRSRR